jgi:hypothetical protein
VLFGNLRGMVRIKSVCLGDAEWQDMPAISRIIREAVSPLAREIE